MRHVVDDLMEDSAALNDLTGNLPSRPAICPDYGAPIIRHGPEGGWHLSEARGRMPTPQTILKGILTKTHEVRQWLTAPAPEALELQRPLPARMLKIVAEGVREDAE